MSTSIHHLVENGWAEPLDADDEEVLGFWRRAVESFEDAAAPRVSRTGQFKHLYDAARQGVVAFVAAHGYRPRGASNHHQHTFATGVALAPAALQGDIAALQVQRGVRHALEYGAHRTVSEEEVHAVRQSVCRLLNALGTEIRQTRPAISSRVRKLRCPAAPPGA